MYPTDLDRGSLGSTRSSVASSTARWTAADNGYSGCDQRYFLFAPHRLPMAPSSSGVSGLGHRVSLFPHVEEHRANWLVRFCAKTAGNCRSSNNGSAFKITGLTWIVERTFAWLGRNRRFSEDYEYAVQTSETMKDIASIRIMINRPAPT
jgi:hypothetical protein